MEVARRDGESFEELFARYKRGMNRSGILKDVKRHRFYMSPGESLSAEEEDGREATPQAPPPGVASITGSHEGTQCGVPCSFC